MTHEEKLLESGDFLRDLLRGVVPEDTVSRIVLRYVHLRDELIRDMEARAAHETALRAEAKVLAAELWQSGDRVREVTIGGKRLHVVTRRTFDAERAVELLAQAGMLDEARASGGVTAKHAINPRKLSTPAEVVCRPAQFEYVWTVKLDGEDGGEE